jgi:hypothetical protein
MYCQLDHLMIIKTQGTVATRLSVKQTKTQ